ncbi:reverse transcriptase domain-containing protein [Tanacetum coccineum]
MTAILKQFQATPPPASVKAVEEICVTCGGAHPYYQCLAADGNTFRDNIQGYVSAAAVNYNQDTSYQAPIQQNQVVPLSESEKIKKINEVDIKAMQAQINNVKNELRNDEMKCKLRFSFNGKNQNHMSLKEHEGSFFQMKHRFYLRVWDLPNSNTLLTPREETLTDPETRGSIPLRSPPLVQKKLNLLHKDHYVGAPKGSLVLIPKYIKMLNKVLSRREKEELFRARNTPLNENLLSGYLKLGLTRAFFYPMTLELANRESCTPVGIARDVFVPVGKFTFPTDFVIVDYESDPRVPLILGRPFLRTSRALIDVHGEEMILRDDLPLYHDNPLTGSTISSSPSLPISETNDYFLEEFAAECNTLKSEYAAEC